VARANAERMPILIWPQSAFELAGKLYVAGVEGRPSD
jgi:hypothetical protein